MIPLLNPSKIDRILSWRADVDWAIYVIKGRVDMLWVFMILIIAWLIILSVVSYDILAKINKKKDDNAG